MHRWRLIAVIVFLVLLAPLMMASSTCGEDKGQKAREQSVETRNDMFTRASSIAPAPVTVNFPIRKALVKFTERQDMLDHPWYIYILSELGNAVGYYVGQTYPINTCDFLSSTEDVNGDHDLVLTAPSLDGVFYGGAGSSAGCDAWFFFDSATDAMIVIRGVNFFVADQPLKLEAEPIMVAPK